MGNAVRLHSVLGILSLGLLSASAVASPSHYYAPRMIDSDERSRRKAKAKIAKASRRRNRR